MLFGFVRSTLPRMSKNNTKRLKTTAGLAGNSAGLEKSSDSAPIATFSTANSGPSTNNPTVNDHAKPSSSGPAQSTGISPEGRAFAERIAESRTDWGSAQMFPFRMERVRTIIPVMKNSLSNGESVVYWMSRDSRVQDNWAFIYAQKMALQSRVPLHVVFCMVSTFGVHATLRAYKFLIGGLREVELECRLLNIPFHLLSGQAKDVLPEFVRANKVGLVVCDFWPLRGPLAWIADLTPKLGDVGFQQVDAHNIVPVWEASDKEEIGARTLRGKIHKLKDTYHTAFPPVIRHPYTSTSNISPPVDWESVERQLTVDRTVDSVEWARPGTSRAYETLRDFLTKRLPRYSKRNDPNQPALSNLSPWFHFGQISVARAIMEAEIVVKGNAKLKPDFEAFFEEAVIRRELSDNFCYYQPNYDNINGAKLWARASLQLHAKDPRPVLYTLKELEEGRTGDDLWNAAQLQLVHEGKCHGFLRMYWAKKILEWTETPEIALTHSLFLNDKYSIDGRDPNGYVGCMWSVCGIHDMGWKERPVFGKIRYMNYAGCQRKFDVPAFVAKYRRYFPAPVTKAVAY